MIDMIMNYYLYNKSFTAIHIHMIVGVCLSEIGIANSDSMA